MMDKPELHVREKQEIKQNGESTHEGPHFRPDVDIFERDDALVLIADVPGATNGGIELDLQEQALNLTAMVEPVDSKWKPVFLEYELGHYARTFRIGQIIDTEKISAKVKDGVLTVTLPKIQKARPRKIEVSSGE